METLLWIFLSCYGLFSIVLTLIDIKGKDMQWKHVFFLLSGIVAFAVATVFTGQSISKQHPPNIKSSKFYIKTEIHLNPINGVEIQRDTIYKFIPKK